MVLLIENHFELQHDKTNKMIVRPAKTQISLGIRPVWSVFAVRMKKAGVLSYPLSAQLRLWSDRADSQADLSLCWAHSHFVGFVMSRLIFCIYFSAYQTFLLEAEDCLLNTLPSYCEGAVDGIIQQRLYYLTSAGFNDSACAGEFCI